MCTDKGYIPKASVDLAESSEFLDTQKSIQTSLNDTVAVLNEVNDGQEKLNRSRNHVSDKLREIKRQVVGLFDDLEEDALMELGKIGSTIENKLEVALNLGKDVHNQLQSLSEKLKPDANISESHMFIEMKKCQTNVKDFQSVIRNVSESAKGCEITFSENPSLKHVSGLTSLGKVDILKERMLYSLQNEYKCVVDTKEDKYESVICGMFIMPNGEMLLSDQTNQAIKRYNNKYKMIARCSVFGEPSQLCNTERLDSIEVAVALMNGTLQFVTIKLYSMKKSKHIKLKHNCNGIAYHAEKFYISDASTAVYIYTYSGKLLTTVRTDLEGGKIFGNSQDITITASDNGGVVYVGDYVRGIITLDLDGNYISTVSCREAVKCSKACSDNHGNILALSNHVTRNGNHGKSVFSTFENNAEDMFLDTSLSTLYVLTKDSDSVDLTLKIYVL